MPIKVTCANCAGVLHAPDDTGGRRGRCPTCGNILPIPRQEELVELAPAARPPVRKPRDEEPETTVWEDIRPYVKFLISLPFLYFGFSCVRATVNLDRPDANFKSMVRHGSDCFDLSLYYMGIVSERPQPRAKPKTPGEGDQAASVFSRNNEKLVGKWKVIEGFEFDDEESQKLKPEMYAEFRSDGTFTFSVVTTKFTKDILVGKYSFGASNSVFLYDTQSHKGGEMEVSGDTLVGKMSNGDAMKFVKLGDGRGTQPK